ncbi:MAG: proton-conducting transporter membrane subunit [Bacillota bacterium]
MQATVVSWLPVVATLLPLVGTGCIYLVEGRSWQWRNGLSVATAAIAFGLVLAMYPAIAAGKVLVMEFPNILPPLGLSFRADPLGFFMAATMSLVWLMVTVYSLAYMEKEHHKKRYYPFLILTLSGSLGVVLTGDMFSLFLFFELMSLTAYVLIIHEQSHEAMKAGYKYLIMTILGSLALFFAIIAVYEISGTLIIGRGIIGWPSPLALGAFVAFLLGFGIKAGMFPLHVWLPDAHPVAPSPASALLSGLMLKTGAYGLIRVIYNVYGISLLQRTNWMQILVWLAAITILLGSSVAILQDDIKRRLAYSSIGQMGYILLGMGLMSERALFGAVFHIFGHALMKSALFLAAGAMIHKTHRRSIADLEGIGYRMPLTLGAFTLSALAMIGIPPLVGFLSKWELSLGALDAGRPWFVVILLASSLMNGVYYFPIIIAGYFSKKSAYADGAQAWSMADETSPVMLVPLVLLAAGTLIFAVLPNSLPYVLAGKSAHFLFHLGGR